jgi:hypothetical protein
MTSIATSSPKSSKSTESSLSGAIYWLITEAMNDAINDANGNNDYKITTDPRKLSDNVAEAITAHIKSVYNEMDKEVDRELDEIIDMATIKKLTKAKEDSNFIIAKELSNAENIKRERYLMTTFANKIITRIRGKNDELSPYYGIDSVTDIQSSSENYIIFYVNVNKIQYYITISSMPPCAEYKILVRCLDHKGSIVRVIDRELLTTCSSAIDNIFADIKNIPLAQITKNTSNIRILYKDNDEKLVAIKGIMRLVLSELNTIENKSINDKNLNKDPMKIIITTEPSLQGFEIKITDRTIFTSDRFVSLKMRNAHTYGLKVGHCEKNISTNTDDYIDHTFFNLYLYKNCEIVSIVRGIVNMIQNMSPMAGDNDWTERNMKRKLTN